MGSGIFFAKILAKVGSFLSFFLENSGSGTQMRGADFCGPANSPAEKRAFELEPRLEPIPRGNQGKGKEGEEEGKKKECPFVQFAKSMEDKGGESK